jgi:endonuclease/exonuclease/phosphatase (EEP) superfamily protein YafD
LRVSALAAAALAILAGGLAQGGRVSPQLDVLTHFAPAYVALGVVAMAISGLVGPPRRGPLLLGLVGAMAGAALMAPEYLRPAPPASSGTVAGQIKLIQFNAFKRNGDVGRVADWLIAQDPDIVTLQEARHDLRDLLRKRTTWQVAGSREHVMIFSREARLGMRRPPLRGSPLTYVNATYPSESGPFEVVTTHLDWPIYGTFSAQHAALARLTAQLARQRMILTGDFNSTPWSFALQRTDRALGLRRLDRASWSFPAHLGPLNWPAPVLPIDHIYAGPGWRVVRLERGPDLGSDHYPLVIILAPVSPR